VVTDELVEFERLSVEVKDFRKVTDHFGGIYGIHLISMKKNRKITASNRLGFETLGF
jgi:hypothetical protein